VRGDGRAGGFPWPALSGTLGAKKPVEKTSAGAAPATAGTVLRWRITQEASMKSALTVLLCFSLLGVVFGGGRLALMLHASETVVAMR